MKNIIIFLLCIFSINLYQPIQAKSQHKKLPKVIASQKIKKNQNSQKFIPCDLYADLRTSPLNRPGVETKQELFTPAEYKKPNHFYAPNMNNWASDNPDKRTCNVGDLHIMGESFPLTSSVRSAQDPFRKPLPGPR